MKILHFHPQAPFVVRITAVLMLAGSVLEAIMAFTSKWPGAQSPLEMWQAVVSPAIWLCFGLLFANGLSRLVSWVYWLAVMLWLPFIFIGTAMDAVSILRGSAPVVSSWLVEVMGYGAIGCYLVACALLPTRESRRAFQNNRIGAPGGVT